MALGRAVRSLVARLVRWAVVDVDGADAGAFPWQQVSFLGQTQRSATWYPYGFAAVAPAGSPALLVGVGGAADSLAHVPGSPAERPALKSGEVAVYHPATQSWVKFLADGSVEVVAKRNLTASALGDAILAAVGNASVLASGIATVSAPTVAVVGSAAISLTAPAISLVGTVTITGDAEITGNLEATGIVYHTHVHDHPGLAQPTEEPRNP